jgi:ankyrin repeat protein
MLHISRNEQVFLQRTTRNAQISSEISFSILQRFPSCKQIFAALRSGDVDQLAEWCGGGQRPDWTTLIDDRQTVDIAAVCSGNAMMVDYVLKHGGCHAYRNGPADTGPPYQLAIRLGFTDVVDVLIEHGLPVDEHDAGGITPLQTALIHKDHASAQKLVRAGAGINTQDFRGNTPLHFAVRTRDWPAVTWLLQQGALPNAQSAGDRWTPLHHAIFFGDVQIAEKLMHYGAWRNLRDDMGLSPLQLAFNYEHYPLETVLVRNADRARECLRQSLPVECSMELRDKHPVASIAVDPELIALLAIGDRAIRAARRSVLYIGNQELYTEISGGLNTKRLLQMRQLRSLMPYPKSRSLQSDIAVSRLAIAMEVGNCRELAEIAFFELLPVLGDRYTIDLVAHDVYDHVFVVVSRDEREAMVVDPWPIYPHATRPLDFHMLDPDRLREESYRKEDQEQGSNADGPRIIDILNAQMNNGSNFSSGVYGNVEPLSGFRVTRHARGIKGNQSAIQKLELAKAEVDVWAKELRRQRDYVAIFRYETNNLHIFSRQVLWPTCLGGPIRYYEDPRMFP